MGATLDAAFIAAAEPWYQPSGDECALFEAAYAQRLPVLLKGPTGCGKTRFIEHMACRLKRTLITIACNDDTSAADLTASTKTFLDGTRADGTVHPGDTLTFTIQPINVGDAETSTTVVSDVLDASLDFVSAGQGGVFDAQSRTVTWTFAKVGLDPVPPLTLVARVKKLPGVVAYRDIADIEQMIAASSRVARAVVIGGGVRYEGRKLLPDVDENASATMRLVP